MASLRVTSSSSLWSTDGRLIEVGMLAIASGIALVADASGRPTSESSTLVWIFLALGMAVASFAQGGLGWSALLAAGLLGIAQPFAADLFAGETPTAPVQFVAGAIAVLSLARGCEAIATISRVRMPGQVPESLLWLLAAFSAFGAANTIDREWTAIAVLGLSGACCVRLIGASTGRRRQAAGLAGSGSMATWILGLMFGATLTISAVATGGLFGWPTAGIAAAGLLALLSIGRDTVVMTARKISELQSRADESQMDALTGLANRRGFDARLSEEVARSKRYGHALSLLMIDIDDFKQVNDRFGHGTGDESLRATARAIESSVRSIDIAARYGGEEFAVILPETSADGAVVVAERIRRANESSTVPVETTVSIGGAEVDPSDADGSRLIAAADAALYVAKRSGKNRVELAG